MFFMVFLVGSVSAATWDNWKYYDKETETIIIKNNFILEDLAKATLTSNTYYCSENCLAEKEITIYEDGVLIEDLTFYRLFTDGSKRIEEPRSYSLQYLKDFQTEICDGKVLQTLGNGTTIK